MSQIVVHDNHVLKQYKGTKIGPEEVQIDSQS